MVAVDAQRPSPFSFIQSSEWDDPQQEGLPASVTLTSRVPDRWLQASV